MENQKENLMEMGERNQVRREREDQMEMGEERVLPEKEIVQLEHWTNVWTYVQENLDPKFMEHVLKHVVKGAHQNN